MKMPSVGMKDVAALAGVSSSTVSNYLNRPDAVHEQTRSRIERAITQLGFVRNEGARQLRAGTSRTIAVVLLDAWIPFFGELATGVEDVGVAAGWTVLFSNSARDQQRELRNLDVFAAQRVGGILVVPGQDLRSRLRNLQSQGITCVTVETPVDAQDISSVEVDDIAGGRAAADHLIGLGRRDVALIGNPSRVSHVKDRFAGFAERAAAAAIRWRVVETAGMTLREGADAARAIIAAPPGARPDAVFAANDTLALGVLHELLAAGVHVPRQVAVLGYDGSAFAAHAPISLSLSTVAQPAYDMGVAAAQILIACMEGLANPGADHRVFNPYVIARESTLEPEPTSPQGF